MRIYEGEEEEGEEEEGRQEKRRKVNIKSRIFMGKRQNEAKNNFKRVKWRRAS